MARYRSKIRFIEAHQIPERDAEPVKAGLRELEIYTWVKNNTQGEFDFEAYKDSAPESGVSMDMESGQMLIAIGGVWYTPEPGEYVVYDEGVFYVMTEKALLATYDSIEEPAPEAAQ